MISSLFNYGHIILVNFNKIFYLLLIFFNSLQDIFNSNTHLLKLKKSETENLASNETENMKPFVCITAQLILRLTYIYLYQRSFIAPLIHLALSGRTVVSAKFKLPTHSPHIGAPEVDLLFGETGDLAHQQEFCLGRVDLSTWESSQSIKTSSCSLLKLGGLTLFLAIQLIENWSEVCNIWNCEDRFLWRIRLNTSILDQHWLIKIRFLIDQIRYDILFNFRNANNTIWI